MILGCPNQDADHIFPLGILDHSQNIDSLLYCNFGWRARGIFIDVKKQDLPTPKHNIFFGHLLTLKTYIDKLPKDAHPFIAFGQMARNFSGGIFYLDMWPFMDPVLMCTSATAAIETTQKTVLATKKPRSLESWFIPIAGGPNLFTMEEDDWRFWRNTFNPGFSQAHIMKLVPSIVHEVKAYQKLLLEYSEKKEMFLLDEVTLWFTMDMIGAIVLLDSKRTKNPLAVALLSQLRWKLSEQELNPLKRWNPIRPIVEWHNSRQMNNYIGKELDKRYQDYLSKIKRGDNVRSNSVISLVLEGYLKQSQSKKPSITLEKRFKSYATYQIRTFLFAGHDTTSSTICYIFYLLAKNPVAMDKIRHEHDNILGAELDAAPKVITENPQILNQLTYTFAVIKESMRLFPAASSIRQGVEGVSIRDDEGRTYPTGNTMVWILHQAMQRDPRYWAQPNDFIPERWLAAPGDPLYPVKGAWRPFEFGPRNCIGQGLVMIELRIILALVIRQFDVRDAYEEFDRLNPRSGGIVMVEGERAYQIEGGGAHPADRFPCRVSLRKQGAL
ncbi:hypothetical protein G7Y89_g599 [Cudoniella acicularis]|uniref:Cytochrome P450 n=1 Tax=Cudoniella acicularis TaxID=354080 RepID=A0A8H4W8Q7_9HELO|nr:hypothetical protein G7Y89_g599 [Cudoniella acicularis]